MGIEQYARTDIQTSDPRAVVVLLYEGAIKFLGKAADAARADARREMSEYILKTQKIIQFLTTALDFDEGGEIASNLERLYAYVRDTLNEANLHASADQLEEVIALFKPLLDAWRDVAQDPAATPVAQARQAAIAARPIRSPDEPPMFATPPLATESTDGVPSPPAGGGTVEIGQKASPLPPSPGSAATTAGRAAYGINQNA
jgi:flagellar protein FliS